MFGTDDENDIETPQAVALIHSFTHLLCNPPLHCEHAIELESIQLSFSGFLSFVFSCIFYAIIAVAKHPPHQHSHFQHLDKVRG